MFDRTIARLLVFVAAAVASTLTAQASTIDFTISGTGSGSFGGQPFTAAFSITSTADTLQISGSSVLPVLSAMVTVPGLGSGSFTDAIDMFGNQHVGHGLAGIIDLGGGGDILDVANPVFATYGLNTSLGPVAAAPDSSAGAPNGYIFNNGHVFPTTAGVFTLTSVTNASFQATVVPEPASLTLLAGSAVGMGAVYLRRRRANLKARERLL